MVQSQPSHRSPTGRRRPADFIPAGITENARVIRQATPGITGGAAGKRRAMTTPPVPEPAPAVTQPPAEFHNDLRDIAMSINAMPDILEAPEMPFMPPNVAGIEETSEEEKEMIQRILDNQPTDRSREEAIMNSSFIDSYDELALVDFDALEKEADEFDVM